MRRLPAFVALALLLSGCSEAKPPAEDEPFVAPDSFEDFGLEDTPVEYGVIRGVVVDGTLAPLADALVELVDHAQNMTTTESGVFAFKDLVPGTYFLKITKDRFEITQASTEVVANVPEPELVKILLQRLPGTEPRVVADVFSGFITCSIRIPAAGFNDGCGVFGDLGLGSTQRTDLYYEGSGMLWWQGELVWSPSGPTSERLCFQATGVSTKCGPSTVVQVLDAAAIEEEDFAAGENLQIVGYPDHLAANASGNLVVQQEFRIAHHMFYNFVPPEGWKFSVDGEPVTPP